MYQRVRRRKVAEINVVPYIDVMLVLLIIFMVTAPLITQGVKVDLPQAEAEPLDEDSKTPIVVSVDSQGRYYVTVGGDDKTPLPIDEIAALVHVELQQNPDTPVVVNGDGAVSYDAVIQLMVLLQKVAGVPSVGLMTDSVEE